MLYHRMHICASGLLRAIILYVHLCIARFGSVTAVFLPQAPKEYLQEILGNIIQGPLGPPDQSWLRAQSLSEDHTTQVQLSGHPPVEQHPLARASSLRPPHTALDTLTHIVLASSVSRNSLYPQHLMHSSNVLAWSCHTLAEIVTKAPVSIP